MIGGRATHPTPIHSTNGLIATAGGNERLRTGRFIRFALEVKAVAITRETTAMANNLHISYDLINPGQNYETLINRIKQLGGWAKIHMSYWYVNSSYTSAQAVDFLTPVLDSNDKVYVVDATNNVASWSNLPGDVAKHIQDSWYA